MLWSKANAGIFRTITWRMSMIHVVTPENEHFYRDEMDQFDTKHAVNMLYIEGGNVLGYQRLLPSTRPYLLSEVMPELCEVERPVGAHIWEVSRHCVAPGHRSGGRFANPVANALGSALVEMGSRMRNFEVYH
jgi:acyl-homoserine lactone synthase